MEGVKANPRHEGGQEGREGAGLVAILVSSDGESGLPMVPLGSAISTSEAVMGKELDRLSFSPGLEWEWK